MKESYGEGVAIHTGPESCAGGCEASGEALTGVRAGWVSSRVIPSLQGADALGVAEGNIARGDIASPGRTLRGPRPHARPETPRARIGRSRGRLAAKGAGQAAAASPRT
jgi:RNA-directed DNA polymerase